MASRRKYRKMWLRWQRQYERFSNRELQKTFHKWGANIPWNSLDWFNYKMEIKLALNPLVMEETYKEIYTKVGLKHGERVGKSINRQLKTFTSEAFIQTFLRGISEYFAQYGVNRIRTVQSTYFEAIVELFDKRLAEGMDIEQAQREIRKIVMKPNFFRWQSLRIARTESTAAANYSASQASTVSGFVMVKEWISALDSRTRRPPKSHFDHYDMNGVQVPEKGLFNVDGEWLRFPGDPGNKQTPMVSGANVINCRCTVAVIAKRDKDGNLIPK